MKFKTAQVGELQSYAIGEHTIEYRDIQRSDGLIRVEYFKDPDPENPTAYSKFRARMGIFQNEYDVWKTVVLDPVTMMELLARKIDEKVLNPLPPGATKYKGIKGSGVDPRQWFGASTDALEEMLCIRFIGLPMNVGICCHINEKKNEVSGEILRGPFAPGRLSDRKLLNSVYQEQYYLYTGRDPETKERLHFMKTSNDGQWAATSLIDAPDPCYPHYESIWANWGDGPRPPLKALAYGDFGTGKSTFFATWPKPLLVWCFDGKDLPYWREMDLTA